jgi:hypothetical protein
MDILAENPPRAFPMLRTTSALLTAYLARPATEITLDSVNDTRNAFRPFLEDRKYAVNSIRTYVNHVRILINSAKERGWIPSARVPAEWHAVLALASERRCVELANYFARTRKTPGEVSIEDVDHWVDMRVQTGRSSEHSKSKSTWFWRLLRDCGCTEQHPACLVREKNYGVPLQQFPQGLKTEVMELLRWKRADYSANRPKDGQHTEATSTNLRHVIGGLFGFAVNVRTESSITNLPQLMQKKIVTEFVEWSVNVRKVKGYGLLNSLRLLFAALRQHPAYSFVDFSWSKPLMDGIPMEPKSELKKRKASKCLEYAVVELIPGRISAQRPTAAKKGIYHVALLAMEELLMKWLITLPWRQRNIRQCRVGGPTPNLFKGKISPFSDIDKPNWVKEQEQNNPEAEFWQFSFSPEETKTGIDVHALLPRQLIGLLEEYLEQFRPRLLNGTNTTTLFVNRSGKPMSAAQVTRAVSDLTTRYGGRRVTPHLFRDIVSFAWLKAHPKDYLTLSKMLWHSSPTLAISTYGSLFNESTGVSAMESWLTERESNSK